MQMLQLLRARSGMLLMAAGLLGACADDQSLPSAVGTRPNAEVVSSPVVASALTREAALAADITVAALIGPKGGSLRIHEAGLKVDVPAGAVTGSPITFTVTALAGQMVAYEFGPHGSVFNVPLRVEQKLKGTNWHKLRDPVTIEAAYFADRAQLNHELHAVESNELLPVNMDMGNSELEFDVSHFSGYMVSSGRLVH
jgi:hypothetical protein